MFIKKYTPTIIIFVIIISVIGLGIWYSDKDSPIKELAKLNIYSKEELSFLEEQGFLDNIDNVNTEKISNSQEVIKALKSPSLIEQNLNAPDESFEVLATKLDKDNYQLAFKLENKSQEKKEFYLIPVSKDNQAEFKEIKGVINNKNLLSIGKDDVQKQPLEKLYDIKQHKKELNPELAQAYNDIAHNNYQAKPIKITLDANTTLLAKSKWEIRLGPTSPENNDLEPVYLLIYGSAGGAKEELTILNVHSHPQQGENWEVSFTTKGTNDLKIIPNDQATIDDDEFTGLFCDNEERFPQILQGDIIYYPDWQCDGTGKVINYTKKAGKHTLRFEFGGQTAYAYNGNDFSSDSNCKAFWNLESGAVPFLADSKGGNTLTNQGFDEDLVDFKQGSCSGAAIRANSDDMYITDANLDSGFPLKSGEANKTFSLAFWIKFTGTISDNQYLFSKPQSGNRSFLIWLTSSKMTLYLSSNGSSWTNSAQHATALVTDRWYHVGVTYDSADDSVRIRIWDDTAQAIVGVDAVSTEGDIYIGTSDFYIGYPSTLYGQDGNLDEIVVFDDILTVDEIDQIHAGTYGVVENNAPTITSVSDYPDPEKVGNDITFSVDWNDVDAEELVKIHICKTNTLSDYACETNQVWCETGTASDDDPETCTYPTTSGDIGSNTYYAFVCDDEDSCSNYTSSTFTVEAVGAPSKIFKGGTHFR